MRTPQRGLRLAAALAAAGLALTALPGTAALADGRGNGVRTLTDAQAGQLAKRLTPDVYDEAGTPPPAAPGTKAGPGPAAPQAPGAAAAGPLPLTSKNVTETVRGVADTTQLPGTRGDYLTVHSLGDIARIDRTGTTVWERHNYSLYQDWQVKNVQPWQPDPYPARIPMGFNAIGPFADNSESGYSVGDLTGDGVADVVFSAEVGVNPYRPFTVPGSKLRTGTFVTVLDGRTGRTLWSRLFAHAQLVKLVGTTLVVADQPSANQGAPKDALGTLYGFRFKYAAGKLTSDKPWTYNTGEHNARWAAVEDTGGGLLAVSWDRRKTKTAPAAGHTLLIDTADGKARWTAEGALYSRQLRYDAARGRLLALEQTDYTDGLTYELAAYDTRTGTRTGLDRRVNAVALGIRVGDLAGGRTPQYAVAEATLDSSLFVDASTVRVLDGGDGATELWSHTTKRPPGQERANGPVDFGLKIADGRLYVSSFTGELKGAAGYGGLRSAALTAYDGRRGTVRWAQRGPVASDLYAEPFRQGGQSLIRTVDGDQNVRTYRADNGRQVALNPLPGGLSWAAAVDINGDGVKDVIAGGESHGLWAYDGKAYLAGRAKVIWKSVMPGAVHRVTAADTHGDGRPELVVAAESEAVIVNARTGRIEQHLDGHGQFVWSVATAPLDGRRGAEVIVPTDKVRAYRGDGSQLWEYAGPAGTVFSDVSVSGGTVYASYNTRIPVGSAVDAADVGEVALDARTGRARWTAVPTGDDGAKAVAAQLVDGVFASPGIPYADGHAVAFASVVRNGRFLEQRVDIRDARTGRAVRSQQYGGPWVHGSWLTGPEGLTEVRTVVYSTYGPGGSLHEVNTLPTVTSGAFVSGPGGRRLLLGTVQNGVYLWDPSILTSGGPNYPPQLAKASAYEDGANLVADLNGDGVDEMILLNRDERGYDQTLELSGGRNRDTSQPVHGIGVVSFPKP
ncbi:MULTISPECIES: FG-GAP-like repeat-containing protein [unclassified Streptomyces]|uniref:FG-GAP-like repeat-containing protein n=1 Tax=unclassified Streptomyces TaxID=2593676 RepID=UPI00381F502B